MRYIFVIFLEHALYIMRPYWEYFGQLFGGNNCKKNIGKILSIDCLSLKQFYWIICDNLTPDRTNLRPISQKKVTNIFNTSLYCNFCHLPFFLAFLSSSISLLVGLSVGLCCVSM